MADFKVSPSVGDEIAKGSTRYRFDGLGWSPVSRSSVAGSLAVTQIQWFYLLSAGQTLITGADLDGKTLSYSTSSQDEILVYLNGIRIRKGASQDYVLTSGSVLTLTDAGAAGDEIEIIQRARFASADYYEKSEIDTSLAGKIDDAQVLTNVPSGAVFTDTTYSHPSTHSVSEISGLQGLLDGKTTESYVDGKITDVVGAAPAALNTLQELGDALGDDANFAGSMTTALAGKVDDGQVLTNVPSGALFTDTNTVYDDTAIQAAVTLNTAKVSNVNHPLVEKAVPSNALFTDTNTTYSVGDGGLTQKNFTTADNTKLDGIATNANNYSHPVEHTSDELSSATSLPTTRPALLMDFGNSKHIDSRFIFTRSSSGSFVGEDGLIHYASSNTPRFDHDPSTRESLGLMIETARSNKILNSDLKSNWSVASGDSFGEVNGVYNPDGTVARGYVLGTTNTHHRLYRTVTLTSASNHTFSCFFKRGTGTYNQYVEIEVSGNFINHHAVTFDLQDMVHTSTGSTNVATQIFMEDYGNGWIRCGFTATPGSTLTGNVWFGFPTNASSMDHSMVGDNTLGMYMWGAQVEQDKYHTSYIPTTTSAATRSQDVANALYSSLHIKSDVSSVSVIADGRIRWSDNNTTNYYVWDSHPLSGSNKYFGLRVGGSNGSFLFQQRNATGYPAVGLGQDLGTNNQVYDFKTATSMNHTEERMMMVVNKENGGVWSGVLSGSHTSTNQNLNTSTMHKIQLGGGGQPGRALWIKKFAIYETELSQDTLTSLVQL